MITGQVLGLTAFLTMMWGIYFVAALREYLLVRSARTVLILTPRQQAIRAFRRVVVDFCVFALPLSVAIRTAGIVLGIGTDVVGGVVFFMLVTPNVIGSIFCVASLRYD